MEAVSLRDIVKEEYRAYQIYTLMDRAIPYLQDGLKPVQRRILYTLWKNQSKGLVKVSAATGLVLTLHPHGPASIEAAIVNLAQDYAFSNNYPLIDKKGYFGERMEPQAAASRYIECKLGKVAELVLFDDMNQVQMTPNYDEKVMEPMALNPKLPVMLLNGAEGIGTGFSSVIPSFSHKDIIESMIQFVETGKSKRLKPWVRYYDHQIDYVDKKKYTFPMKFEERDGSIYITELPRGYDAQKIYRYINKFMEKDFVKDYIDSSVDNDIEIELIFKRGQTPTLAEVVKEMSTVSSLTPNYTLISENGVKVLERPEEIIDIFTARRLVIVKSRYELLAIDAQQRITQNNEIIRFIKQRHYAQAEKSANRKAFVDYLKKNKFTYADYLSDMAIYRMTKDEVGKRKLLVEEDKKKLADYNKVAKSPALVKKKLIEELRELGTKLTDIFKIRERERRDLYKKLSKKKRGKKK